MLEDLKNEALEAAAKATYRLEPSPFDWDELSEEFRDLWRRRVSVAVEAALAVLTIGHATFDVAEGRTMSDGTLEECREFAQSENARASLLAAAGEAPYDPVLVVALVVTEERETRQESPHWILGTVLVGGVRYKAQRYQGPGVGFVKPGDVWRAARGHSKWTGELRCGPKVTATFEVGEHGVG